MLANDRNFALGIGVVCFGTSVVAICVQVNPLSVVGLAMTTTGLALILADRIRR